MPGNECVWCDVGANPDGWSNRPAGTSCGECKVCDGNGTCVAKQNGVPCGDQICDWCQAGLCVPVTTGTAWSACPNELSICGRNGKCDGTGACAYYGPTDSVDLVSDGNACTKADYCPGGGSPTPVGEKYSIGAFDGTGVACGQGGVAGIKLVCTNTTDPPSCGHCGLGAPCPPGFTHCCGDGYCKTCCNDSDCPSGQDCGQWASGYPLSTLYWGCK